MPKPEPPLCRRADSQTFHYRSIPAKIAYIIHQANTVSALLEKFTTAHAYQVAGQFANIGFWIGETLHALDAIATYAERFESLKKAQSDWISTHHVVVGTYCRACKGPCEFSPALRPPRALTMIPADARNAASARLRDAMYYFLLRCYRMNLINEAEVRNVCDRVGTSVETRDLDRK